MRYAIVYSSLTGNTKQLAETIRAALPAQDCVYFGEPSAEALSADLIYAGFWTDKGQCDTKSEAFLETLTTQKVFLFGTAGFGGAAEYFDKVIKRTKAVLPGTVTMIGSYMCQGRMPMSVRQRYEKMQKSPIPIPRIGQMIENFDNALSHPDEADLAHLRETVLACEIK